MGLVWVCVVLVLCVACVALYACGVRRLKGLLRVCLPFIRFSSSLPSFSSLYLLFVLLSFFTLVVFWLSSCIVFVALWVCWVFFFPCGLHSKREGAECFPCVLSWCVGVVLDVFEHYRYFLRFIVPMLSPFTDNSCNLFRMLRCVFSFLPVFIYH